jgi:hypothetical protein
MRKVIWDLVNAIKEFIIRGLIVAVNGIRLKGWEGRYVLELFSILLQDINTIELRLMLKDLESAKKYSNISDDDGGIKIISPSKLMSLLPNQKK